MYDKPSALQNENKITNVRKKFNCAHLIFVKSMYQTNYKYIFLKKYFNCIKTFTIKNGNAQRYTIILYNTEHSVID